MSGRTLFDGASPKTQSVEAVKQLITYQQHHGQVPAEMPPFYRLSGEMVLVLSNKKDAYYVVTPTACSCPAATYHPGQPCKHMKALQAGNSVEASRAQARAYQARQRAARLKPTEQVDSIRPAGKWAGGHSGPVLEIAAKD